MRNVFLLGIGIAASAVIVTAAFGESKDIGAHSASEVQGACKSAGGTFTIAKGGSYFTCQKKNCDGKGGSCEVSCVNGGNECVGTTPERRVISNRPLDVLRGSTVKLEPKTGQKQRRKTGKIPSGGLLNGSAGGFATQGPAATGSPLGGAPSGGSPSGGAMPAGTLY